MTRLHEAASAVKHKVQGKISQCFSSRQMLLGEDGNLGAKESDDSELSVGPSLSSVTEYFDAEADNYGTSHDLSDFDDDHDASVPWQNDKDRAMQLETVVTNGTGGHPLLESEVHRTTENGLHPKMKMPDTREKDSQQQQEGNHQHRLQLAPFHRPHFHSKSASALPLDAVPLDVEKVTAMKEVLRADTSLDQTKMEDVTLMRFLIARNVDVQKAAEMFAQHCKWREEFVPRGYFIESECAHQLAAEKTMCQGLDRHGRPLMIVIGCKHLAKDRDMEEFKRYAVYCMDKTIASMPEGVDKFCCIFDLENTGLKNFDTSALFVILDFFQAHYPERLCKIYMIHVPYVFWGIWRVTSKVLLPRTRAKITFLTDEEASRTLREELGDECLPKKYGGAAEFQLAQDLHLENPPRVFC